MERADTAQIQNLKKLIEQENHAEIQNKAADLYKTNPNDSEIKLTLIIAALKNNKLSEVAGLFKNVPTAKDPQDYQLAYGYYLYLLEDYQKAIKYILELNSKNYQIRLLLSQCYFKALEYKPASELYIELVREKIKQKNQNEVSLLLVNLLATQLGGLQDPSKILDQFGVSKRTDKQFLFNLAQLYHEINPKLSLEYINKFSKQLKLPADEEDRIASVLLVDFLKLQNEMDIEEAKVKQYSNLSQIQYKEINLDTVITNNTFVLKERSTGQYSNEAYKEIEQLLASKSKQTREQIFRLKTNKLILLLRRNRFNEAHKLLKEIDNHFTQQQRNSEVLIKARLFLSIKNHQTKDLQSLIQKTASNQTLQFLLKVYYLKQSKQLNNIFNQYKKSSKQILNNQIISKYIIALALKDEKLFQNQLEQLNAMATKTNDIKLMKILVEMFKNKGNNIKIIETYERIIKANPKDQEARLGLAQIRLSQGNIQAAEQLLRNFEKPQQITDMNYLQALENNIHFSISKPQNVSKDQTITKMKKRIKKKKPRYPQGFDPKKPGPPPNPERWLPKYERKDYKKKKNFKSGRTQGATVGKQSVNTYTAGHTTSNLNVNTGKSKRRKN